MVPEHPLASVNLLDFPFQLREPEIIEQQHADYIPFNKVFLSVCFLFQCGRRIHLRRGVSRSHAVNRFAGVNSKRRGIVGIGGQSENVASLDFLVVLEPSQHRRWYADYFALQRHSAGLGE